MAAVDGALFQAQPVSATTTSSFRRLVAAPAAETVQLASEEATGRTTVVYGVLAGAAAVLALAGLLVPRGDLWSAQEG